MHLTITSVRKNPILLVSTIMAMISWLIMFIGGCIIGRAGLLWWIIIYELLLIVSLFFSIYREVFHHYHFMFLIFLGVSISFLTSAIDGLIHYGTYYGSGGNQAAAAGAVILIVMQFFWVILFGSTPDSIVSQSVYSGAFVPVTQNGGNAVGLHDMNNATKKESKIALSSPEAYHQQPPPSIMSVHQQQPPMMMSDHINNQIPAAGYGSPVVSPVSAPSVSPVMSMPQPSSPPPQIMTATALHPYTANPDDPNELSFVKGEMMEILNKSGNWWQAKKQDGTIGIVPSNYFGQ